MLVGFTHNIYGYFPGAISTLSVEQRNIYIVGESNLEIQWETLSVTL